ncbi:hypothetical protein M0R45_021063 [Rubus argutus]|uniref:Uncharacterized protein n=1 Tax=Rubus argutus TaxID=59490 RepID=A0AAW1XAN2_RUBAR
MSRNEWQKLREERRRKIWRICVHIIIYFLALLPIPQVAVLVIFIRMRDSVVYEKTSIVIYLVLQYLVRAYQIYQSCNKFKRVRRWVKGAFYFFLYILAAHVLGAFWYFCSIQRETSCWQQACKNTTRNLSNFGTNLEPSSYLWENCFAILICVIGLLLFMYLLGNVQTYIQMETQKTLLIEEEMIKKKYQDIKMWMSRNGLPKDMKKEITEYINKNKVVEKDLDVDVDINFLFSVTPPALRSSFKVHLCIDTLKKVPVLENMDEDVLISICIYLEPVVYTENNYLVRAVSDNNIKWDQGFNSCAGASTSGTVEHRLLEQIIQLQGDMLREQLVLVRESMLQLRDDMATQGRRLNDITEFLARSGYPGTPPPTP